MVKVNIVHGSSEDGRALDIARFLLDSKKIQENELVNKVRLKRPSLLDLLGGER